MNKNSKIIAIVLVVIAVIIIAYISMSGRSGTPGTTEDNMTSDTTASTTPPVSVSDTKQVSSTLSEYHNSELGFAVKYPSDWEKEEGNAGITFIIPVDPKQTTTIATLQTAIQVFSSKCAFPPVTTVKDRSTIKVGSNTFNMISMSNTVQGRVYFNRMYSLQQGSLCYMFSFASVASDPKTKGLTGSNITVAQNNNKAIVNSTDSSFTDMVKSFIFVSGPQGEDETQAAPKK